MNGKQARRARQIAHDIRHRHREDVIKTIAEWPWWKRAISWTLPKLGERWAAREIEKATEAEDFAERRTYQWIKERIR